jgi:hypothetical protein
VKARDIKELPTKELHRIQNATNRVLMRRAKRMAWGRHRVRTIAKQIGCSVKELIDGRSFSGPMKRAKATKHTPKKTKRNGK